MDFRIGLETLKSIESARAFYVGIPADVPERPVVDKKYDYSLTVVFDNVEAHNAYQEDPLHKEFLRTYSSYWKRVRIYDSE